MTAWRLGFWLLFAVTLAVYATMLVWTLPAITAAAGGLAPFDMRPSGYSFDEAKAFLTALSPDGKALYLDAQHKLDAAYPALLAATLFFAIAALAPKSWGNWRWVTRAHRRSRRPVRLSRECRGHRHADRRRRRPDARHGGDGRPLDDVEVHGRPPSR